jgi:predicted XRE-type DNA-binding protein
MLCHTIGILNQVRPISKDQLLVRSAGVFYEATKEAGSFMKTKRKIPVRESGGNIFADLGFPNAEREQLKAHLALRIYRLIKQRGLTQAQAGKILGIKQPPVSAGYSGAFSVERLMDFLTSLGQDVEITVKPSHREHGEVLVHVA